MKSFLLKADKKIIITLILLFIFVVIDIVLLIPFISASRYKGYELVTGKITDISDVTLNKIKVPNKDDSMSNLECTQSYNYKYEINGQTYQKEVSNKKTFFVPYFREDLDYCYQNPSRIDGVYKKDDDIFLYAKGDKCRESYEVDKAYEDGIYLTMPTVVIFILSIILVILIIHSKKNKKEILYMYMK